MLIYTPSHPLKKALSVAGQNASFQRPGVLGVEPPEGAEYGNWSAGYNAAQAPKSLLVYPLCVGGPGTEYSMRLYSWRLHGQDPNTLIWISSLIVELRCVAGEQNGLEGRLLAPNEFLADTIEVVGGDVGKEGFVVSPGGGMPAYACVDLLGCQKYKFDFTRLGNALWATL